MTDLPDLPALERHQALRKKIRAADPCLGLFVKSAAPTIVETLGGCGLDFIAFDAEHNAYDRGTLDHCLLAARSVALPALVRVPEATGPAVMQALDMGAAGIIAPHIRTAADARALAAASRYQGGSRGFSPSHRAGGYGRLGLSEYRDKSDEAAITIAQIEDAEAVEAADAIMAVEHLDAVLIGPVDLANALGCDSANDRPVRAAIDGIRAAGRRAGRTVGQFFGNATPVAEARENGIALFMIATELSLLAGAAKALSTDFRGALT